ncbi:hypothetical protein ACFVFS_13530, partial [Kitasatospora sp. NPDC057692]
PGAAPAERSARPDAAGAAARFGAFRRAALPAADPAPGEDPAPAGDTPGTRSAAGPASDVSPVTEKDTR